jgi:uncharacterized repeat protein (TIGR01451 family)
MSQHTRNGSGGLVHRGLVLGLTILCGLAMLIAVLIVTSGGLRMVYADPLLPPQGYPKLSLSLKVVTPTLDSPGGATLYYQIEIRNTGAYTAAGTTLTDVIPDNTSYNHDARASAGTPVFHGGMLAWAGDVGFDETVVVSFSVDVASVFLGTVRNTAVISQPLIARPITVAAETVITDQPILTIGKTSPPLPGANKLLTYTLVVTNVGQPASNMLVLVTDTVPANTLFSAADPYGSESGGVVEWTRNVTLGFGQSTVFTFSVDVADVPSGTVIVNDNYRVSSPEANLAVGQPYTVTVVDPVFRLHKYVWPDPPGSNREMTYTLTVRNVGSLATHVVVTDRVPAGVEYRRGGTEADGVVSWSLPSLNTGESASLTYTVYISDVMDVAIVNDDYWVCSDEGVCELGRVLTSVVWGPTFETTAMVDPIAKKPGGGGGPVTPTLVVRNLGPGDALGATVLLEFIRISVSANDLYAEPAEGTLPPFPSVECGDKCVSYVWTGDLAQGDAITFTTKEGQSTIGGDPGTIYTATVVVSDTLANAATDPVTGTASGRITHYANLIPIKQAPAVIGRGQLMTYTIQVWNSALTVDGTPAPVLTDVVPMSVTVESVSDGGITRTVSDTTVISWVLPALSTGDRVQRSFAVRVDNELVSGTQILNADYGVSWREAETSTVFHNPGKPVTTTVVESGLVDSYKTVTPVMVLPGPGKVLAFSLHIVNSGALDLTGVTVYDFLPWQDTTYRRDAIASAGEVYSDIVSVRWVGDVAAFSTEIVTLSVEVDPDFQGPITNTAVISHSDLLTEVVVSAVAYVTEKPVLQISKSASPDPVAQGGELAYTIKVINLGQQATDLVITDTVPSNAEVVPHSMTGGGLLEEDEIRWQVAVLGPGESHTFGFRMTVQSGDWVVNDRYAVRCAEGVVDIGAPVRTRVLKGSAGVYLPIVLRNW